MCPVIQMLRQQVDLLRECLAQHVSLLDMASSCTHSSQSTPCPEEGSGSADSREVAAREPFMESCSLDTPPDHPTISPALQSQGASNVGSASRTTEEAPIAKEALPDTSCYSQPEWYTIASDDEFGEAENPSGNELSRAKLDEVYDYFPAPSGEVSACASGNEDPRQSVALAGAKDEDCDEQCSTLLQCHLGCCIEILLPCQNEGARKCFVNILYSELLGRLSLLPCPEGGEQAEFPYVLRSATNYGDEGSATIDIAVGTDTFMQAEQDPRIMKTLMDTAVVASEFLNDKQRANDYMVLRRVTCKGAMPAPLSVSSSFLKEQSATPMSGKEVRLCELRPPQGEVLQRAQEVYDFVDTAPCAWELVARDEDVSTSRVLVPEHKLLRTGLLSSAHVQESDAISGPDVLTLVVELPSVTHIGEILLDIAAGRVRLEVAEKYSLDLHLSCEVDHLRAQACFVRAKGLLTLQMPTIQAACDPPLAAPFQAAGVPLAAVPDAMATQEILFKAVYREDVRRLTAELPGDVAHAEAGAVVAAVHAAVLQGFAEILDGHTAMVLTFSLEGGLCELTETNVKEFLSAQQPSGCIPRLRLGGVRPLSSFFV